MHNQTFLLHSDKETQFYFFMAFFPNCHPKLTIVHLYQKKKKRKRTKRKRKRELEEPLYLLKSDGKFLQIDFQEQILG